MGVQVLSLMWLRTTVNFQYANGTSMGVALRTLYSQGGIPRFYRGLAPALIQGPLSRFGDTAANTGILSLWAAYPELDEKVPTFAKSATCSLAAALFRIFLMPVDTFKTTMQVQGSMKPVLDKVKAHGPSVLYHGSLAAASATFIGHYPWFATYNYLDSTYPKREDRLEELLRRMGMGFCASAISDTCSNSVRVVKTTKQASLTNVTYPEVVRAIVAKDGVRGLMFRGLETKIFSNGLQGIMFSVLWKYFEEALKKMEKK